MYSEIVMNKKWRMTGRATGLSNDQVQPSCAISDDQLLRATETHPAPGPKSPTRT